MTMQNLQSSPQSVSGAYDRITAHEDLCAERYANIHSAIADVKATLQWIMRGVLAVLVAVSGWAFVQLWNGRPAGQAAPTLELRR